MMLPTDIWKFDYEPVDTDDARRGSVEQWRRFRNGTIEYRVQLTPAGQWVRTYANGRREVITVP